MPRKKQTGDELFRDLDRENRQRLETAGWKPMGLEFGTQTWLAPDGKILTEQQALRALDRDIPY